MKDKQAREEEDKMQMTRAQRRSQGHDAHTRHTGVPLAAIYAVMNHALVREEEIDGQKYWVVSSEPRKNAVAKSPMEEQALCYRYLQWIDEKEKVVARREWEVIADASCAFDIFFARMAWYKAALAAIVTGSGTSTWRLFGKDGTGMSFLSELYMEMATSRASTAFPKASSKSSPWVMASGTSGKVTT